MSLKTLLVAATTTVFAKLAYGATREGGVAKLTEKTFDEFIADNSLSLVKFYAPWCGHCKSLAPHYEDAAKHEKLPAGVALAEVDVTEQEALGTKFEIRGFPTIKFFRNGVSEEYTGGRTTDTIVEWLSLMTSDPITWVESLEKAIAEYESDTLCYANITKDGESAQQFQKIAEANRLLCRFIATEGSDTSMSVIRAEDKTGDKVELSKDIEEVAKFIKSERLPYFGAVTGETFASYMESGLDFVWMAGSAEDKAKAEETFTALGKDFRGEFNFVWLDTEVFQRQADGMLGVSEFPAVIRTVDGPGRFVYGGDLYDKTLLSQWVNDMKDGKLVASLKSEPIPDSNDEPVKVVVGSQFTDIVAEDKDVLLEVYAPWCGHCQKLAPAYEKAAEDLQKLSDKAVMCKLDGTANEISTEGYDFQGFPTIFWKKAGEKPVIYSGGRDADDFVAFFAENGSKPFEYTPKATEAPEDIKDEL